MAAPIFQASEFNPTGTDPTGQRHLNTHPSFSGLLNTTSRSLNYGSINTTTAKATTSTRVHIYRLVSSGDATTQVDTLKYWLPITTAFNGVINDIRFNQQISSGWIQNNSIDDTSAQVISTTLPTTGNLLTQGVNGSGTIVGTGDLDVTAFIYTSITANVGVAAGHYGGLSQNSFVHRLTFDYF